ncbi:MAG: UDP-3-O-(3-hydroxymyristoyl)glucosamine N-acyltransferase [Xenococcaceae cyanobacterium MO_188.B32]|nr:UDP-3-O-(3-hydroxymyristoyl)glucosamine N-acyltransferase [Xenococcaceae cyanobacterium MO_188.B32]
MKFSEIISSLGTSAEINSLKIDRNLNPDIEGMAAVDLATSNKLSYIEGSKFANRLNLTNAGALILPRDEQLQAKASEKGIAWIATRQPRLMFARVLALFYQPFRPAPSIHPTAIIDDSASIGKDVYIGAHVVIEKGVTIGDRVCIYPNVVVYPDVEIGNNTILHANCTIHERSKIGTNCVIHSGAVIGAEGFGFVPTAEGWFKMEQSGYTVLEDGVEIGCNSAVDRPSVGETRVGCNTKIDNLVQIGHGCQIGQNCAIAGQAGLAGGVTIGNRVMLGGQVGIANQAKIGDGAIAAAQSGITSTVAPGAIVSGSPAMPNKLYLKVSAISKRLPEVYKIFQELKQKI